MDETSAIKIADVNLEYNSKMTDHNSNLVLELVSSSFCIQKYNLKPTLFPAASR